jgi:hypothetical protein
VPALENGTPDRYSACQEISSFRGIPKKIVTEQSHVSLIIPSGFFP